MVDRQGGHHLTDDGQFESDKYRVHRAGSGEDVTPDKLVLSFHDTAARAPLRMFAAMTKDEALKRDIIARLRALGDTQI